ncbi:MAG TPA: bi-domain-containing oxidoreductase [Vicinamibacterales bacterium]|nr:bi-domain-containing oxidoreductase [Vicinamibacterales bacterium]
MRQILMNSRGAMVVRMPRPAVERGCVLVRVHYSLVSVGTETAPLKEPLAPTPTDATVVEKGAAYAAVATHYAKAAWRDPQKAARRLVSLARQQLTELRPAPAARPVHVVDAGQLQWTREAAVSLEQHGGRLVIVTDDSSGQYQAMSQSIPLTPDQTPVVRVVGTVQQGAVSIGLLNDARDRWLGSHVFDVGPIDDLLTFDPAGATAVTVVVSTAGGGRSRLTLDTIEVSTTPSSVGGLPASELDQQGWNIGYSVSGEVVAVGDGVSDLVAGDLVACAGAGQANHAEFVSVKRNLVCRLPRGCPMTAAASATIGAIAMQGVRRAAPQLGELVAVIGLGLIGQITAQLLRNAGGRVIGLDLDGGRVDRAKRLGLEAGASDPDAYKTLVRDITRGVGADRTIITAATRSDAVVNLAMEVTRAKGVVVIVGDVGLKIQRPTFYRKEIDLLMSTSYGPGRYDSTYEEQGHDYPISYVRWTLNRNMQSYLHLVSEGRVNIDALVDRVIAAEEAPAVYKELARDEGTPPLGVLIRYPEDTRELPEPADATRIVLRGAKPPRPDVVNCALVGAGAFGIGMIAPQLKRRKDRFSLMGVVSRHGTSGSNFARENQIPVLTTELRDVLDDPSFHLVVIATRHDEHAAQAVQSIRAGKHVFVEKPLAITWTELESVVAAYRSVEHPPILMVGFNRRFSPAIAELRRAIGGRRAPLVISYRLNGGYIPLDHWVQGPQGGGRNIGEACHMYDVFRSLAGAPVRAINAAAIDPDGLPYLRTDNFSATLQYEEGSVATLTYTALGPKAGLAKERIEVFSDGDAFVIDDFKKLTRASDGAVLWQSSEADKGHADEFNRLADAIAGNGPPPIPFDEIVETTAVALHVEDLIHYRYDEAGE